MTDPAIASAAGVGRAGDSPVSGPTAGGPVLEVATLDVRPGMAADFERAFAQARPLISASPGFLGVELRRCVERPDRYLLLVRWASIADHEVGFRQGPDYPRWRALLHHFYDPFPVVEHYTEVPATF